MTATPSSRELDDMITRHLDGGLDAVEQRQLAALLDASPAARKALARYLRLEGALIRLASAGLVGSPVGDEAAVMPRIEPSIESSKWLRPATLALAGSVLAATLVAGLFMVRPGSSPPRGDVALIADRWLDLRQASSGAEPNEHEPDGQEPEDDEPEPIPGSPPGWLVAAVADEGMDQPGPDKG